MSEAVVRLASRGDGVTESGRHVPLAAPGDMIGDDGTLTPGPHRAVPPCRHFPDCGGCQLQHVDDAAYAAFIADRIASALAAQGLETDIRAPHLSPPRTRRRASLRVERHGKAVRLGFNAGASHRIVDMRECHILRPELFALVAPLRDLLGTLLGPRDGCGVRLTLADQGVDVMLEKLTIEGLAASEALTAFAREHALARLAIDDGFGPQTVWEPQPVTITLGGALNRHPGESRDPRTPTLDDNAGAYSPTDMVLGPGLRRDDAVKAGIPVPLPHNAFLQATADGEGALVAAVREAVGHAATTADLFAGLGTFALSLPSRVYAAEGARDAALALKSAANSAQRAIFVDHRDLFRRPLEIAELERFNAIVLDPPRAGAKEQIAELAKAKLPRIAYASCNPATFARDAKGLADGGWKLRWIQPVGQFRWSTHVELVGAFER